MKVKLSDILEALEFANLASSAYVNLKTGKVVALTEDDISAAEDDSGFENYPQWQAESIAIAKEIIVDESKDYLQLPDSFEIDEYHMMEHFIRSLADDDIAETLAISINGSGAFRRFKDHLYRLGIQQKWFDFRAGEYKQQAVQWCDDNNIDYIED